jgi:imidazolonepropionase-like amidohydrolase
MVALGMKPMDALKAATSVDAQLLGVADRTGTLEAGKQADIVACPGNPGVDVRQVEKIRFVMKGGVVVRNGS